MGVEPEPPDPADIGQAARLRAETEAGALDLVDRAVRESRGLALRSLVGRLGQAYAIAANRLTRDECEAARAAMAKARAQVEAS